MMSDDMGDEDPVDFLTRNMSLHHSDDGDVGTEDPSGQLQLELEVLTQGLYHKFQGAATCVAQLYKDRIQGSSIWVPFQCAAGSVTGLYREGNEAVKRAGEIGYTFGCQKRTRDVMAWVKRSKRRHIHRDELIAFLLGKPASGALESTSAANVHRHARGSPRPKSGGDRRFVQGGENGNNAVTEELLHTFQEAITVASINAAVGHVRSSTPSGCPAPTGQAGTHITGQSRRSGIGGGLQPVPAFTVASGGNVSGRPSPQHFVDLNNFVCEEFARHGLKRPAPPSPTHTDEVMDSPTHKKPRFM